MKSQGRGSVILVDPIGGALGHYELEFAHVVETAGGRLTTLSLSEPSISGHSRIGHLIRYLRLLVRARLLARTTSSSVIVAWPLLHYLDIALVRLLAGPRSWIVFHDPRPLVATTGHGSAARAIARLLVRRWRVIVHTELAAEHFKADAPSRRRDQVVVLPHPLLHDDEPTRVHESSTPTVRVLGQYKPDRDLSALAHIAAGAPPEWRLEILGRGWPDVAGWTVESRFLTEAELAEAVRTASVVVIPYTRFYQSGIAVRCIEAGVPFTGPLDSTLADFGTAIAGGLVGPDGDWAGAVTKAMQTPRAARSSAAKAAQTSAVTAYRQWLDDRSHSD